jgi:hypothetical protein
MTKEEFLTRLVLGLVVGIVVHCFFGGLILMAACWLYNKLAGSGPAPVVPRTEYDDDDDEDFRPRRKNRMPRRDPDAPGVPVPGHLKAMGLMLALFIAEGILQNLAMLAGGQKLLGLSQQVRDPGTAPSPLYTGLASGGAVVLGWFALAWLLRDFLPTRFSKGLIVGVLFWVIYLVLVGIVLGLLVLVLGAAWFGLSQVA